MLRRSLARFGGGDKSSFAAKRQVIHPLKPSPSAPAHMIQHAFQTDALKFSQDIKFFSGGEAMKDVISAPPRLEGEASRKALMAGGDAEFEALVEFIRGARHDDMITGRRFQKVYDALTEKDDLIVWLCMTAMAILNPGDIKSRLLYRHLEALVQAVASAEMTTRVAFRFYEAAVRSPAYREIAARNLETGASTRIAGICAAADALRRLGVTRRPMTPYFELYNRITERSEAMTPWGYPPLFQFEERMQLEKRLRFFGRAQSRDLRRSKTDTLSKFKRFHRHRIFWLPVSWATNRKWVGNNFVKYPGMIAD